MPEPLHVSPGVVVPETAIEMRAVRASGPGGQNVNKVASKVELRVDLSCVLGLDAAALARLRERAASRLDALGRLVVTSQRSRDQSRNLFDARSKLRELIAEALVEPKRRRRTRPTASSREARLSAKRRDSDRKRARRRDLDD